MHRDGATIGIIVPTIYPVDDGIKRYPTYSKMISHLWLSRMTLNDHNHLDILYRTALTGDQRQRLLKRITQFFKEAIDARSPRNRPPGKAGLRAEKGYYRLLYLEGEFHQRVNSHDPETPDGKPYSWENMIDIVDRLGDLSELQSEMIATIESAVDEMVTTPNQGL